MAALCQDLLNRRAEVGDGELGRTLRYLQHRYFAPPAVDERVTPRMDSRSLGFRVHHLRRRLAAERSTC